MYLLLSRWIALSNLYYLTLVNIYATITLVSLVAYIFLMQQCLATFRLEKFLFFCIFFQFWSRLLYFLLMLRANHFKQYDQLYSSALSVDLAKTEMNSFISLFQDTSIYTLYVLTIVFSEFHSIFFEISWLRAIWKITLDWESGIWVSHCELNSLKI